MATLAELARRRKLAGEMSHLGYGYTPTQNEINTAINVGMGRQSADVAYGEEGLRGGTELGRIAGMPVSLGDVIPTGSLAKLAMMGGTGLSALGGTMGLMSKMGAGSVPQRFGQSGAILSSGLLKKGETFPKEIDDKILRGFGNLPENKAYDVAGNVFDSPGMSLKIAKTNDGLFAASYNPMRGQKGKGFYLTGDNPDELVNVSLEKMSKSSRAVSAAEKRGYDKSVAGMIEKEHGSVFDYKNSERSKSQYITHKPSGLKIRISDHSLPLGYEQADLDLPIGLSSEEQAKAILNFLKGSE